MKIFAAKIFFYLTRRNKYNSSYSNGFTLAEVLITIGVIGIVAAITIPTLISNYQKDQTIINLKKIYTTLSQAVKQSESDNGPNEYWDWGTDETSTLQFFNTYLAPYLKIIKKCNTYNDCGYKSNDEIKTHQGDVRFNIVSNGSGPTVILSDGTMIKIQVIAGPPIYKNIFIDINGAKSPNILGKDAFRFSVVQNKGFVPYGYDFNPDSDCSFSGYGYACAAKIIRDNWQIKDDYPW